MLLLLAEESRGGCSREELVRELAHLPAAEVGRAVVRLDAAGVVERRGEHVWASRPARRLDELGLIAV